MTPTLVQLTRYMSDRERIFRLRPPTGIPLVERYSQVERLVDELWTTTSRLGFSLGPKPTITSTGTSYYAFEVLHSLTRLETEVLCTFLMTGLGEAYTRAILTLAQHPPAKPSPDFREVFDDVYACNDKDEAAVGED